MPWIKHVLIDLAVTVVIIIATFTQQPWAVWAVLLYTPFMLLLKLIPLLAGSLVQQVKGPNNGVPDAFYHLLFALNLAALLYAGWWITAAQWGVIWVLSVAATLKPGHRFKTA